MVNSIQNPEFCRKTILIISKKTDIAGYEEKDTFFNNHNNNSNSFALLVWHLFLL